MESLDDQQLWLCCRMSLGAPSYPYPPPQRNHFPTMDCCFVSSNGKLRSQRSLTHFTVWKESRLMFHRLTSLGIYCNSLLNLEATAGNPIPEVTSPTGKPPWAPCFMKIPFPPTLPRLDQLSLFSVPIVQDKALHLGSIVLLAIPTICISLSLR